MHAPDRVGPSPPTESDWDSALTEFCSAPWGLRFAFQTIFDVESATVCGYEALARFDPSPGQGPEAWFAAAARHHVAGVVESHAVRLALSARDRMPAGCFLAINVTPTALVTAEVREAFAEAGRLDQVVVEITEQSPVADYPRLRAATERLRAAGASLAIDDVGSGHSGLRQVTELRPDYVKIDRPLISYVDHEPTRAGVVEGVALLCARIGARPVAEGVERPEELQALSNLGVSLAQGYLIGHPETEPRRSAAQRLAAPIRSD